MTPDLTPWLGRVAGWQGSRWHELGPSTSAHRILLNTWIHLEHSQYCSPTERERLTPSVPSSASRTLQTCHDEVSKFVQLLAKPGCNYLEQEDFIPFLQVCLCVGWHSSLTLSGEESAGCSWCGELLVGIMLEFCFGSLRWIQLNCWRYCRLSSTLQYLKMDFTVLTNVLTIVSARMDMSCVLQMRT